MTKEQLIELGVGENTADEVLALIKSEEETALSAHNDELARLSEENDDRLIGFEISNAISKAGVWSEKAVYALLDLSKITVKDGKVTGVDEEIARIKNECGILFKDTNIPRVVSAGSGSVSIPDNAVRTAMGI